MSSLESTDHVLWHDEDHSIFLLDGPASIASAQGPWLKYKSYALLSAAPVSKPFMSHEPASQKARQRLLSTAPAQEVHIQYAELLKDALSQMKNAHQGPWLLPRAVTEVSHHSLEQTVSEPAACHVQSVLSGEDKMIQNDWPFVSNTHRSMTEAVLGQDKLYFFFPSRSTFMLADCADRKLIASFHSNVRGQASDAGTPWRFDCLLIDPPWSNHSVKRKRSLYKTSECSQIASMLSTMDLDRLMAADCLVGVWITSKPSVRETVMGEEGLFQAWGVDLVEEWLWLKVTTEGESVIAIDGLWRKPYEVLLLGRRRSLMSSRSEHSIRRRVLVSVPDVHSRKPCLKSLLEPMLPAQSRVLEIFARHLVSGWWSWGDECIKFNETSQWQEAQGVV